MVALDDWTVDSKLTDEDKLQCSQIVESYLAGRLKDPVMAGACTTQTFKSSIAHCCTFDLLFSCHARTQKEQLNF